MTHCEAFSGECNASAKRVERFLPKSEIRACTVCGRDFEVVRSWQRQCSPRCQQWAYVQRKITRPIRYGA